MSRLICNLRQGHGSLRLPPESLNEMWVCVAIIGPDTIETVLTLPMSQTNPLSSVTNFKNYYLGIL